jgi:hypothetical protein
VVVGGVEVNENVLAAGVELNVDPRVPLVLGAPAAF